MLYSKRLFIIDGLGAILSAFMLGAVLPSWQSFFGIPINTLYFLASLPLFFAIYDGYCLYSKKYLCGVYLKAIAIINILYCILSVVLAVRHIDKISSYGWAYIIIEIAIVLSLAFIEYHHSKNLK